MVSVVVVVVVVVVIVAIAAIGVTSQCGVNDAILRIPVEFGVASPFAPSVLVSVSVIYHFYNIVLEAPLPPRSACEHRRARQIPLFLLLHSLFYISSITLEARLHS